MINVLVVDDHHLMRTAITSLLEDVQGITVVGEACDGETAITLEPVPFPPIF